MSNSPYSGIGRPPPSRKPAQVAIRIIFFTGPRGRRPSSLLQKPTKVDGLPRHLLQCLYHGAYGSDTKDVTYMRSRPHYLTTEKPTRSTRASTTYIAASIMAKSSRILHLIISPETPRRLSWAHTPPIWLSLLRQRRLEHPKRSINAFSTLPPYHQNTTKIDLGTSMTLSRCHYYGKTDSDIQGATYMRSLPYYLTIKTPQRLTWVHPQPTYLPNITHIQAGRDFHHVFFFSILTTCIPFSCVLFFSYYLHHFFCGFGRSDFFHLGALLCVHSPTTVFLSYSPLLLCCVHHFLKGTLLPWSILQGEEFGRFWFGLGVFSFRPLFSLLLKKAFLFITFCSC